MGFREAVGMAREKVWVRSLVLYNKRLGNLNYLPTWISFAPVLAVIVLVSKCFLVFRCNHQSRKSCAPEAPDYVNYPELPRITPELPMDYHNR